MRNEAFYEQWEETTRNMVADPDSWPLWPYLPIKKVDDSRVVGYLFGDPLPDGKVITILGLMYDNEERRAEHPRKVYDNLVDFIDDGWRVD